MHNSFLPQAPDQFRSSPKLEHPRSFFGEETSGTFIHPSKTHRFSRPRNHVVLCNCSDCRYQFFCATSEGGQSAHAHSGPTLASLPIYPTTYPTTYVPDDLPNPPLSTGPPGSNYLRTSRIAGGWPSRLKLLAETETAVPGVYSGRNPLPQRARARAVFPTPLSPSTNTLNKAEGGRPATVHVAPLEPSRTPGAAEMDARKCVQNRARKNPNTFDR